ncbi:hypothetical protein [Luteimonas sp. 3794]|uniref:hypothetical protein n=1 Tax=Luteimonas sp. 3794 TaxID=2817730 RepID=UPI0028590CF1|nr:hypothetical protein [Luteimonas sp. 3794]MDR6992906.1 hypothetical protein [Luteimonas sp. 3794]
MTEVEHPDDTQQGQLDGLRRLHAEQQRELDTATRQLSANRTRVRWALGLAIPLILVVSVWCLHPVVMSLLQGYIVDCPRMSFDCRRRGTDDPAYWGLLLMRSMMGLLFLSAAVFAVRALRALSRPPPVLEMMRAQLHRLQRRIDALDTRP